VKSELATPGKPIAIITAYYGKVNQLQPLTVSREHGFCTFLILKERAFKKRDLASLTGILLFGLALVAECQENLRVWQDCQPLEPERYRGRMSEMTFGIRRMNDNRTPCSDCFDS
jgi:hypothetical protein